MSCISELEIHSAILALPSQGLEGVLNLGGVAPSMLWAASQGWLRCPGATILDRFHESLSIGAAAMGACTEDWATLRRRYPVPVAQPMTENETRRLRRLHEGFADGIVAALLNQERGEDPACRAGYDRIRRLFVGHGAHVRALRAEAEAQLDEGLCDGAAQKVDARRQRFEAAYRLGTDYAKRGADPRAARLRVEARRSLRALL